MAESAQAWAAIYGREYVIPDDVKEMAPHVLTHRLMISPQAQLRGRPARTPEGQDDQVGIQESVDEPPLDRRLWIPLQSGRATEQGVGDQLHER